MRKYVALLRGIMPTNPNMRNEKLRGVFEKLGLKNVQTVISSGNVLFETTTTDTKALESTIEQALFKELGFHSATIIRSKQELETLVKDDPFEGKQHAKETYLFVTFTQSPVTTTLSFPYKPENKSYTVLGIYGQQICSIADLSNAKTPDVMQWLEKEFGDRITSRTYNTVEKTLRKMDQ